MSGVGVRRGQAHSITPPTNRSLAFARSGRPNTTLIHLLHSSLPQSLLHLSISTFHSVLTLFLFCTLHLLQSFVGIYSLLPHFPLLLSYFSYFIPFPPFSFLHFSISFSSLIHHFQLTFTSHSPPQLPSIFVPSFPTSLLPWLSLPCSTTSSSSHSHLSLSRISLTFFFYLWALIPITTSIPSA